ncbi:hypothetical protein TorRG33x02_335270 [Trema orientale]|uniref:Uncharacterized protein n=1 Tax=Trema orientale TaxID=63057 RepID=A0A2P5B1R9_TREOI|nr:hypothetical protein TorRG33x02_335270 [Trema orientale]
MVICKLQSLLLMSSRRGKARIQNTFLLMQCTLMMYVDDDDDATGDDFDSDVYLSEICDLCSESSDFEIFLTFSLVPLRCFLRKLYNIPSRAQIYTLLKVMVITI